MNGFSCGQPLGPEYPLGLGPLPGGFRKEWSLPLWVLDNWLLGKGPLPIVVLAYAVSEDQIRRGELKHGTHYHMGYPGAGLLSQDREPWDCDHCHGRRRTTRYTNYSEWSGEEPCIACGGEAPIVSSITSYPYQLSHEQESVIRAHLPSMMSRPIAITPGDDAPSTRGYDSPLYISLSWLTQAMQRSHYDYVKESSLST